ncbi:MAG: DUF6263 family protein [Lacipirellulaceae bacterium]
MLRLSPLRTILSLALVACVNSPSFVRAQATATAAAPLAWKFEAGDQHHYEMTQKMNMSMNMGQAGKMDTSISTFIDTTWDVEGMNDEGNAVVKQNINRMKMDIQGPGGQNISVDTAAKEKPEGFGAQLAPLVEALTSQPFTVTMTPQGKILTVDVPDELLKKMQAAPGAAMMGELASKKGFEQLIRQGSLYFPEGEIKEGQNWSNKVETKNPMFGKQTIETTYTYAGSKELEGKEYEVFKPNLKLDFGDGEGARGTQVVIDKQGSSGEILFDREAGHLAQSMIKQNMELTITAGGQNINQVIKQTIDLKRVEKKEK